MRRPPLARNDLEELYRHRFGAFVRGVTAVVGDGELALDVVQEAFAKAVSKRRTFRGESDLEAWVWSIVLNSLATVSARACARDVRIEVPAADRDATFVEPDDPLRALVLGLPERQRLTIFLRYYADLSYDQIAAALDVSPGTVAASLNAAHHTLRQQLSEVQS